MLKSFRLSLIIAIVAAATLPVLVLSYPVTRQITSIIGDGARRELNILATTARDNLQNEFTRLAGDAIALGADSDINRGVKSLLFVERADLLLSEFVVKHEIVSGTFLLDHQGEVVTAAPLSLVGQEPPEVVGHETRAIASDIDATSSKVFRTLKVSDSKFLDRHFELLAKADVSLARGEVHRDDTVFVLVPVHGLVNRPSGVIVITIPVEKLLLRAQSKIPKPTVADFAAGATPDHMIAAVAEFTIPDPAGGNALTFKVRTSEPRVVRFAVVNEATTRLAVAIAVILALLALFAIYFGRSLTRPLAQLRDHAATYASGNYAIDKPRVYYREFQLVTDALYDMGTSILGHIEDEKEKERLKFELAQTAIQSELDALRKQMSPHFLFNALNSIATMTAIDAELSVIAINRLANLYRSIIESSKSTTVPLSRELDIVRNYLELEKMRFGKRLEFDIESPGNEDRIWFPGLLLQTLVENAVKHGVSQARGGGRIAVRIVSDGDNYSVSVKNSGAEFKSTTSKGNRGTGTGLENTKKRLEILYGKDNAFHIGKNTDGETEVTFKISGEKL